MNRTHQQPAMPRQRSYSPGRLLHANLVDILRLARRSRASLLAFLVLSALGTVYFLAHPPADRPGFGLAGAVFETLRLFVLQSSLDLPGDWPGRLLFFLLPLLGLALVFQSVLNFGKFLFDKAERLADWQLSLARTYRRHVLVCGLGRVGFRVATRLQAAGYPVVVIERDWHSEFVERLVRSKIPVICGDAREPDTLQAANVRHARALIATINDDLLNIEIALGARRINPHLHQVLRIANEELDVNLEDDLGANTAFNTGRLAAPAIASSVLVRQIDHAMIVNEQLLGVTTLAVAPGASLVGRLDEIEARERLWVLHHQGRAGRLLRPPGATRLAVGDQVTLLGSLDVLARVRLNHTLPARPHLILCGLGEAGYRVLLELRRMAPEASMVVILLAGTARAELVEQVEALGVPIINGDARQGRILQQAGLDHASALVTLTSNDLVNLEIALEVRKRRKDLHVVLRVFSDVLAERLQDIFGLSTAFSTSDLAAATLAASAIVPGVRQAVPAGDSLLSTIALAIDGAGRLAGRPVGALEDEQPIAVLALSRGDQPPTRPSRDEALRSGDRTVILGPLEHLERLRALNRKVT